MVQSSNVLIFSARRVQPLLALYRGLASQNIFPEKIYDFPLLFRTAIEVNISEICFIS